MCGRYHSDSDPTSTEDASDLLALSDGLKHTVSDSSALSFSHWSSLSKTGAPQSRQSKRTRCDPAPPPR